MVKLPLRLIEGRFKNLRQEPGKSQDRGRRGGYCDQRQKAPEGKEHFCGISGSYCQYSQYRETSRSETH